MTTDLKVNTLSGNALTQIDTMLLNACYINSQFDTTIANCCTKSETDGPRLPIATDTTNLKSVIFSHA